MQHDAHLVIFLNNKIRFKKEQISVEFSQSLYQRPLSWSEEKFTAKVMREIKILIFLLLIAMTACQPPSCNNYFRYVTSNGGTYGLITYNPVPSSEHVLTVVLSIPATQIASVSNKSIYFQKKKK